MSTRRFEDDPQLTAYALGELEPEEARQIEALLAEDAGAREFVVQVRTTASRLASVLRAEAAAGSVNSFTDGTLTEGQARDTDLLEPLPRNDEQSLRISDARPGQEREQPGDWRKRRWRWHHALAAAASLAVVGLVGWSLLSQQDGDDPSIALSQRPYANSDDALAEGKHGRTETTTTGPQQFEDQRRVERDLIEHRFEQAMQEAQTAQDPTQARVALQKAQAARDSNPGIFSNESLSEMDRQIAGARSQVNGDEAAAMRERESHDRTLAEAEAHRTQVPSDQQRRETVTRLQQDMQDALASGNKEAAKDLGDQIETIRPGASQQAQAGRASGAALPAEAGEAPAQAPRPAARPTEGAIAGKGGRAAEKEAPVIVDASPPAIDMIGGTELNFPVTQPDLPNRYRDDFNTEQYDRVIDNAFKRVTDEPLSTFSVDVDTASYANVRRFLTAGQLPPPDAVRIEELVNYFDYSYTPPATESQHPFAASVAVSEAPWNAQNRLVRIGIKGKEIPAPERPPSNLVFLLDVSGSMEPQNKLPLVKRAMRMLAEQLDERDRVAIVVYAGSSGLVLPSTSGAKRDLITGALDRLDAGGSTNGGQGIQLAYQVARENLIKGGINRVILCTDGDFNIGVTDRGQLTRLIEEQAKSGVYLSILGFGMGNLKDATMEELTNKGEGNYSYIDTEHEARKLLVEQMQGTLQSIAKDVKIQVEFNPAEVGAYRLIGYENRVLAAQDFNDDTKDAGDIGAGHEVTALYEVVPVEVQAKNVEAEIARLVDEVKKLRELLTIADLTEQASRDVESKIAANEARIESLQKAQPAPAVDELKYQEKPAIAPAAQSGELLTVKLRYKGPEAPKEQGTSTLIEFPVKDEPQKFAEMDQDFQLAASVAGFGMLLRDSPYKGSLSWAGLEEMTRPLEGFRRAAMEEGSESVRRLEFRALVQTAAALGASR